MKQLILAAVFVAQLMLVLLFWYLSKPADEVREPFVSFDVDAVTEFIVRGDEEEIQLHKRGESWLLPDDYPADAEKIERVLDKLASAEGGWPVATSASTAKRFEVTEEKYQKHISVSAGENTMADIYLGTSPGFRKTHARKVEGGPVYAIEFSNYEAGTTLNSWLDKYLLRPIGPIQSLTRVDGFTLSDSDEGWISNSDIELDESKVRSYADRFETLTVFEISDAAIEDLAPTVAFDIVDDQGSFRLEMFFFEDGDNWVARSDRFDGHFGVAKYIASELDKQLEEFVEEPEQEETDTSDEGAVETIDIDLTE